jgi:hypothetical protein
MYNEIKAALLKSEQAICRAIMHIIGRQEAMVDMDQLRLPTRLGGLGVQSLSAQGGIVCKAGFLAAVSLTQQALATGCDSFQPFKGESAVQLQQLWKEVNTACTCKGACACEQTEVLELTDAVIGGMLPVCSALCP